MIRSMRGTTFAVCTGVGGVLRGQQQNSSARHGGLRSRVRVQADSTKQAIRTAAGGIRQAPGMSRSPDLQEPRPGTGRGGTPGPGAPGEG